MRHRLQRPKLGKEQEYGGRKGWRGRYRVYVIDNGTTKRRGRELTFYKDKWKTKTAAQDEFDRIVKANTRTGEAVVLSPIMATAVVLPDVASAPAAPQASVMLCDLAAQYLVDKKGSWSPHWFAVMSSLFRTHLTGSALSKIKVSVLTRADIQQYLNNKALTECNGIVTKLRTHINAILERAVDDDLILKNRAKKIDMPKLRKVDATVLTKEHLAHILVMTSGRDGVVLALSICLGLRPSETFALRVNDYQNHLLRIDEGSVDGVLADPKSEESGGFVHLPEFVKERIEAWITINGLKGDDFLFAGRTGRPMRQNNYVRRQLRAVARELKIPKITFQICRRSFGTHIQDHAKLKELQGAMRHARANTSLDVYAKERAELTAGAVNSLTDQFLKIGNKA